MFSRLERLKICAAAPSLYPQAVWFRLKVGLLEFATMHRNAWQLRQPNIQHSICMDSG